MIQARRGVFETNSSMTHSITMCTKSEFDRWEAEDLWMLIHPDWNGDEDAPLLMDDAEIRKWLRDRLSDDYDLDDEEQLESWARDYGYMRWSNQNPYGYAYFEETYTTDSGEDIVAFGWYGHD